MYDFAFIDKAFDINQTQNYILSIQASLNGFSFCILDHTTHQYILLKHIKLEKFIDEDKYVNQIENILEKDEILKSKYKNIRFIFITRKSTLIPSPLFDIDHIKLYFQFNQDIGELDELHVNQIESLNAHNIFAVPNRLAIILTRKFQELKFYHQATPFLERCLNNSKDKITPIAYTHFYEDFFGLAVMRNKKLVFYNSFHFGNDNDILFYILNSYKQLNLDQQNIQLLLSGNVFKDSTLTSKIKEYIKHVSFEELDNTYTLSSSFDKIKAQSFMNLFNL